MCQCVHVCVWVWYGVPVCMCVYVCAVVCVHVSGDGGKLSVGVGVCGIVVVSSFQLCGSQ